MTDDHVIFPVDSLRSFATAALVAAGAHADEAKEVASVLCYADLRGIDSHGVARLPRYVDGLASGGITPRAQTTVVADTAATAALDAGNGLGQPAAALAMRFATSKAAAVGVGVVTVRRSNHFGVAGYYSELAASEGMVGIAMTNASPQVAPTHGARPMFGTNPIGIAIPTGGAAPYSLDMATSIVPRGRLEQLVRRNEPMPEGWVIDAAGNALADVGSAVPLLKRKADGSLLPLGGEGETYSGYKGYALGLLVDLLCGPLAGASWGRNVYGPDGAGLGHVMVAIRVDAFQPLERFEAEASMLLDELRASPRLPGRDRIYTPGEKQAETAARRAREGIPLVSAVVETLSGIGERFGVPFRADAAARSAV